MKMGMTFPINPLDDSDLAMDRYLTVFKTPTTVGVLTPDEDSMPVSGEWYLPQFDEESREGLRARLAEAGETMVKVLKWLGGGGERFSLDCRHGERTTNAERTVAMPS